jgi:phospholipid-translocating ATPase
MGREVFDDLARRRRDREANSEFYEVLGHTAPVRSRDLQVGDLVKIVKDQRLPADILLLRTGDGTGEAFIRTDQLDGETDWKLRTAPAVAQDVNDDNALLDKGLSLSAEPPMSDIHKFNGTLNQTVAERTQEYGVGIEGMLWANTVLASGPYIIGVVVYTGVETRQAFNTSKARAKFGLLENEINNLSKVQCFSVSPAESDFVCHYPLTERSIGRLAQARTDVVYVDLALSHSLLDNYSCEVVVTPVPFDVSLRVNLDLGKSVYAYQIEHDHGIPGTIVRTSTIPEELGRIEYLFTDKTGTITKNGHTPNCNR